MQFFKYFLEQKYSNRKFKIFHWIEKYQVLFLVFFFCHLYQWNLFLHLSPKLHFSDIPLLQWPFQISENTGSFICNWGSYSKLELIYYKLKQLLLQFGTTILLQIGTTFIIANRSRVITYRSSYCKLGQLIEIGVQ